MSINPFEIVAGHRWLFLLAHPDDEMAVLAWMRRLDQAGVSIRCVWLHSTPIREAESRMVMRDAGIADDAMIFWQFPDGNTVDHLDEILEKLKGVVDEYRPTRAMTLAFEQGHLDHDTAHLCLRVAFPGTLFEWPMYYGYYREFMHLNTFTGEGKGHEIELNAWERAWKTRMVSVFKSQTMKRNLLLYRIFCFLTLRPYWINQRETARLATWTDFRRPNLDEETREKVLGCARWARWRKQTEDFLVRHGM